MTRNLHLKPEQESSGGRSLSLLVTALVMTVLACSALNPTPAESPASQAVQSTGGDSACVLFDSVPAAAQYNTLPPQLIDSAAKYSATVKMAKGGEFVIELYADKAPIAVNSFVFLSCKGFFDGVTYHRVLDGFMAQGGDPTGTGMGGPGYEFVNEESDLTFDRAGRVAMANAGRDTNGSQFFITFAPVEYLNGDYTIFGRVISGLDVVNGLTRRNPDQFPSFSGDAMESITISLK